ncbi:uncharacterized protein METZ01_LOCUS281833, partial [marine metagenome]
KNLWKKGEWSKTIMTPKNTGNNSDNATLGQSYKFYNFLTLCC